MARRHKSKRGEALKLTSKELLRLNVVDDVIKEPLGGAHRNINETIHNIEMYVTKILNELKEIDVDSLLKQRYNKITSIGRPVIKGA